MKPATQFHFPLIFPSFSQECEPSYPFHFPLIFPRMWTQLPIPFTSHLPLIFPTQLPNSIYLPFSSHFPKNVNPTTNSIYRPFTPNSAVSKCDPISLKPLKTLFRDFLTHNQVFKVQNVPYISGNVPFPPHFPQNPGFTNGIRFFLKPPKILSKDVLTHNQVFKV